MRKRRAARLPVVEADSIEELLTSALRDASLENHRRRSFGLALSGLAKARRRSKGRYVLLEEREVLRLLRCLAELNGCWRSCWESYFVE